MKKIAVSGGFDPVHIGHLQLLDDAKSLGTHLTVILNSDRFLKEKKGYFFMPFKERKKILLGFELPRLKISCLLEKLLLSMQAMIPLLISSICVISLFIFPEL